MFWKKDKKRKEIKEPSQIPEEFTEIDAEKKPAAAGSKALPGEYGVLKGFYVSEKATGLASFGQYVFNVFDNATKNEIKKQVERGFNVKVRGVKIVNLPRKSRTIGRHKGFKRGFKKAMVALEEGYSIEQEKA